MHEVGSGAGGLFLANKAQESLAEIVTYFPILINLVGLLWSRSRTNHKPDGEINPPKRLTRYSEDIAGIIQCCQRSAVTVSGDGLRTAGGGGSLF